LSAFFGTRLGLSGRHFGMVGVAKNFEPTNTVFVGIQMVMATGAVTCAVTGLNVVDLAVASLGRATRALAAIFGSPLGRRAGESPDVVALPFPAAFVRTPGSSPRRFDECVAELASPGFAAPLAERTRNSFVDQRHYLRT